MKHQLFTQLLFLVTLVSVAQSPDQNYVLTQTMTSESGTAALVEIQYYDGLGRPIELVRKNVSPNMQDVVSYQEYDAYGRTSNSWLPRVATGNNGSFVAFGDFENLSNSEYQADTKPYGKPVYEASPLNRITEQYGPGADWHNNGKSVRTDYLTNNATAELSCIYYSVEGTGLSATIKRNGTYGAGQLFVNKTTDEDGHVAYEFKDKLGRVVLTRQKDGSTLFDTYFVYDDLGNLSYVLSPQSGTINTGNDEQTALKQYAYIYKYDNRNRCIKKRLPGTDWVELIYDRTDRLILSQDGEQRLLQKWLINKYDELGRLLYSGILQREVQQSEKEFVANNVITETYVGAGQSTGIPGYSCNYFVGDITPLQINYYDNYQFLTLPGFEELDYLADPFSKFGVNAPSGMDTRYGNNAHPTASKGLLTGTVTAVMNQANTFLYAANYYDYRARLIQHNTNTLLPGYEYELTSYNFTGQITQKLLLHRHPENQHQTELYEYTYDHAGRLLQTTHKLNNGSVMVLEANTYDELGRLKTTMPNEKPSLKLSYQYNLRSQLTDISGQKFTEQLYYQQPLTGGTAYYNGNIGTTRYNDYMIFHYQYDQLNRLKESANSLSWGNPPDLSPDIYTSTYQYDKNGNITYLWRTEDIVVEAVNFTYVGNQRHKTGYMSDEELEYYYPGMWYYNGVTDYTHGNTNVTYSYNKNGSLSSDPYKGYQTTYDLLGQPQHIQVPAVLGHIYYTYSAAGEKLKAAYAWHSGLSLDPVENTGKPAYTSPNSSFSREYIGNKVYENGVLKRILLPNGYISNGNYYFYLRDHLGNNVVTASASGTTVQQTYYYPYGKPIRNGESTGESVQPYKFGGKEHETMFGLASYDFHARTLEEYGSFTTVDPAAERYPNISPYAYCANNPIIYIDPTGMYIEEGSQKEWERRKSDVTSQRDYLQKRVDKLTAKAEAKGWSSEKLASRIGDKTERIGSLNTSLGTMGTLESSSQGYSLSHTATGENGGVTLNTGTNTIDIKFGSGNTGNFVHEVTHAGQFETGDMAFDSKSGMTLAQDIHDEVSAYKAQYAYDPSSVSGLTSTSYANSFGAITTSWVQGLAGGTLYAPGGTANTGIGPLNINSTRTDFINAYPSNPAMKTLPASFILRTSYPNIYYKK